MEHYRFHFRCQYQTTAEGDAAKAFMDTWATTTAEIVANAENGHQLAELEPPHVEGCVSELSGYYHVEVADFDAFCTLRAPLENAIYQGPDAGGVAAADCASSFGASQLGE